MRFYYKRENVPQPNKNNERKSLLDKILEETSSKYPTSDLSHKPISVPVEVGNVDQITSKMKFISQRRMGKNTQTTDGVDLKKVRELAQEILNEISKEVPENIHLLANELVNEFNHEESPSTKGVANPLASGTTPIAPMNDTFTFSVSNQRKAS